MEWTPTIVVGVLALAGFGAAVWLFVERGRRGAELASTRAKLDLAAHELEELRGEVETRRDEVSRKAAELAQLVERIEAQERQHAASLASKDESIEAARAQYRERLDELNQQMSEKFRAASSEALKTSTEAFLKLAQERLKTEVARADKTMGEKHAAFDKLVEPISETLSKTQEKLELFDIRRADTFAKLTQQITDLGLGNSQLRDETGKLVKALSKPEVRGRYGEIQLRRVAELAGMTAYCDFSEQASSRDDQGRLLRPDMVVSLPNNRRIAVDAKTNTQAYLDANGAETPEARDRFLEKFARHVAEQAQKLGKKGYWAEFEGSPEFVVMFVPGDHFLDTALERRPELLDFAAQHNVVLATPSTLIGLLRAVHVGWREKTIADEAEELLKLGRELHDRAVAAFGHANKLGDTLRKAVEHYNKFTGSVDSRLMPTLRKFEETGAKGKKELQEPLEVVVAPKLLESAASTNGAQH